ncbi:MAG: alpha-ribazole phosphatase [Carboxydocellales bacterium]
MTRILLIRHGETIWNNEMRYQGHSDIPLSDEGREQAKKLSARLAGEEIDHFYASDLSRAYETAEIIAAPHHKTVQKMELLRETMFGAWEGLKFTEIQERFPEVWAKWRDDPRSTVLPEGESLDSVYERVNSAINQIRERHPKETVVVVGHGGIIRLILYAALDLDIKYIWRIRQDNTALNIIDYYGERAILSLVNDISHLALGIPKFVIR